MEQYQKKRIEDKKKIKEGSRGIGGLQAGR